MRVAKTSEAAAFVATFRKNLPALKLFPGRDNEFNKRFLVCLPVERVETLWIGHFLLEDQLMDARKYKVSCRPNLWTDPLISLTYKFASSPCTLEWLDDAIKTVNFLHERGLPISQHFIYSLLLGCIQKKNLATGRWLHSFVASYGFDLVPILVDQLIRFYASLGSLLEANVIFCKVVMPSVYTWHAIISAHVTNGQSGMAVHLYYKMQLDGIKPNRFIFSCVLKACGELEAIAQGKLIHDEMVKVGNESDVVVGNTLIDLYAKCGCLDEAFKVFDELPNRTVVSWSVMIAGYVQHGCCLLAFELFDCMQHEGTKPNKVTMLSIVKACGSIGALRQGKLIHNQIIRSGLELDVFVSNTLIDMYAKCGKLAEARQLFDQLLNKNIVSWGAMIAGYTQHGHMIPAVKLFEKMQMDRINADKLTFLSILKACGSCGDLRQAKVIHEHIMKSGLEYDVVVGSTLVDMYAKCGSLEEACKVFNKLANRNVVWAVMIAGYTEHGDSIHALEHFEKMQEEGIKPDKATYLCTLKACGSVGALEQGKLIHKQIILSRLESDVIISSTIVDMYAKCGWLEEAREVFDRLPYCDVVAWGAIISGYAQQGQDFAALELFERMQLEGISPDKVLFSCILKICGNLEALQKGTLIHDQILSSGLESDPVVATALIDMYVRCGNVEEAQEVFNKVSSEDLSGAMIAGYAHHGHGQFALELFKEMQHEGKMLNKGIFLSILKSCSSIGALDHGRLTHDQMIKSGVEIDVVVGSSLLDMYAKCGRLEEACKVFEELHSLDVVSWGAMIAGYAQHGNCWMAKHCLEKMQEQCVKPNATVYVGLLSACSQVGHVEEGHQYFKSMRDDHGIMPSIEHFNCVVDLLGRAGLLKEAVHLLQSMPISPDITGWISLLTACRTYGSIELGRQCFDQVMQLDPNFAGAYVLMSNIYADAHLWDHFHKVQELRKGAGLLKKPGMSWIEISEKVYEFMVGGQAHPQSNDIYAGVSRLTRSMKEEGYVPQQDVLLELMYCKYNEDDMCENSDELNSSSWALNTCGYKNRLHRSIGTLSCGC